MEQGIRAWNNKSFDLSKDMSGLTIKIFGNRILTSKSTNVRVIDKEIKKLAKDMAEAMYKGKGIGLAAPQVGVLKRIIVFDAGSGPVCLINPKIVWKQDKEVMSEGCLSFPGINLDIKRNKEIVVQAQDIDGKSVELNAKDVVARIIQHEVDHLDGILIVDRVSKKKLKSVKNELEVLKKSSGKS